MTVKLLSDRQCMQERIPILPTKRFTRYNRTPDNKVTKKTFGGILESVCLDIAKLLIETPDSPEEVQEGMSFELGILDYGFDCIDLRVMIFPEDYADLMLDTMSVMGLEGDDE